MRNPGVDIQQGVYDREVQISVESSEIETDLETINIWVVGS